MRLSKSLVLICGLLTYPLLEPPEISATTLTASSQYDLNGAFKVYFHSTSGGPSYAFHGTYNPGAALNTSGGLGNNLNVTTSGSLTFTIYDYNSNSGQLGAAVGSATGILNTGWANVGYNQAQDVAGGIKGSVSGGALLVHLNGSIGGNSFNFASGLQQTYASASLGQYGGVYDNLVTSIGTGGSSGGINPTLFSVAIGDTGLGVEDALLAWFVGSNAFLLGNNYTINADITARYSNKNSEVPEPATLGLLGSGLIGTLARRRRNSIG